MVCSAAIRTEDITKSRRGCGEDHLRRILGGSAGDRRWRLRQLIRANRAWPAPVTCLRRAAPGRLAPLAGRRAAPRVPIGLRRGRAPQGRLAPAFGGRRAAPRVPIPQPDSAAHCPAERFRCRTSGSPVGSDQPVRCAPTGERNCDDATSPLSPCALSWAPPTT
jgi:hypothetical protein